MATSTLGENVYDEGRQAEDAGRNLQGMRQTRQQRFANNAARGRYPYAQQGSEEAAETGANQQSARMRQEVERRMGGPGQAEPQPTFREMEEQGKYLLRDPEVEAPLNLPGGAYEIPLVIQDRMFYDNGQLLYPVGGANPDIHPLWQPEFFGDVILANGKVWPYLNVEPRKYRFRMLNGSNARFYALQLFNDATGMPGPGFWQIGSDGGYLDNPVLIANPADPNAKRLVMAPGERFDVIIDFSGIAPGTTFTMKNNAKSPYPNGAVVDPQTTGQIMQFRVVNLTGPDTSSIATPGTGYVERLSGASVTRTLTLDEVMGPNGPVEALLNNMMWDDPVTELPMLGATEIWRIVNTTGDAHPIHLHLAAGRAG